MRYSLVNFCLCPWVASGTGRARGIHYQRLSVRTALHLWSPGRPHHTKGISNKGSIVPYKCSAWSEVRMANHLTHINIHSTKRAVTIEKVGHSGAQLNCASFNWATDRNGWKTWERLIWKGKWGWFILVCVTRVNELIIISNLSQYVIQICEAISGGYWSSRLGRSFIEYISEEIKYIMCYGCVTCAVFTMGCGFFLSYIL